MNNPEISGYRNLATRMRAQMQAADSAAGMFETTDANAGARAQPAPNLQSQLNAQYAAGSAGQPDGMLGQQTLPNTQEAECSAAAKSRPDAKPFPANVAAGRQDAAA